MGPEQHKAKLLTESLSRNKTEILEIVLNDEIGHEQWTFGEIEKDLSKRENGGGSEDYFFKGILILSFGPMRLIAGEEDGRTYVKVEQSIKWPSV